MTAKPIQVIAVTGGKGGVGKSHVAINLGVCLANRGRRVALLDADLGLANVDVLLGLSPKHTLEDVLYGDCELRDIIVTGPAGMRIIPAASGVQRMAMLGAVENAGLIRAFSDIASQIDVLLVDTAAGISDSVVSFVNAAQETLVVVCDEPSSVTDAYALIKLLARDYGKYRFRVVANMTRSAEEGRNLYARLLQVTDRFLDVTLQYEGHIPFDEHVRQAVKQQRAVVEFAPSCRAARAISKLAESVCEWPLPALAQGHLEFFVEQLVQSGSEGR